MNHLLHAAKEFTSIITLTKCSKNRFDWIVETHPVSYAQVIQAILNFVNTSLCSDLDLI